MNTVDDKIIVNPELAQRLALPSNGELSSLIFLRFDFFKKKFAYSFYGLDALFSKLGGSGNAANGALSGLA